MLLRLRISLPDRPGGLGHVARALGVLGADILQVTVLEREAGRAVDDFVVSWPGQTTPEAVLQRLSAVQGARVEAVWPTRRVPGSAQDYELLLQVTSDPARGLATLVDALPVLCGAEWAAALTPAEVRHRSVSAPEEIKIPGPWPVRPQATVEGDTRLMLIPEGETTVVVGRTQGPPYHRVELERAASLVAVVTKLAAGRAGG
ncbi:amino acid-binding protein [Thermoactinospora rubra]|uniref:amino acid-binding protein n=1 Tax=Thermoactinospora rubra TaxID=1088767 RepID=UPI000A1205FD|nr:amino acid-binding protein [Thermoactinospora rubra]